METNSSKVSKIDALKGEAKSVSNPFAFGSNGGGTLAQSSFTKQHRLNDYDFSMMNSRSYLDMDDETAKLEFQITEKEKSLASIRAKIKGAEQIAKVNEVLDLKIQEKNLEQELVELNRLYSQRSMKSKVQSAVANKNGTFPVIDKIEKFISRKILPKVSKKFENIFHLSGSLDTLQSINQNIDELIDMKVPYGEQAQNYEKLTAYLNRANKIHSQISKSMKRIK